MKSLNRNLFAGAAAIAALLALALAPARANDVTWSVGVHAAPGVHIGATNARPYYVQPAQVYVAPQPVYVQPPGYYVRPAPIYVRPAPVYHTGYYYGPAPRGHGHWKHHHKHGRGHRR